MAGFSAERRRRLTQRAVPALGAVALAAFVVGAVMGAGYEGGSIRAAREFAQAWESRDYEAMHGLLAGPAADRYSAAALRQAYENARATATATAIETGDPRATGDGVTVPVTVGTRIFGTVRGDLVLPMADDRVEWAPNLAFPGVPEGSTLTRTTEAPKRAAILSQDGKVITEGDAGNRSSPLGPDSIAGRVAPPDTRVERNRLFARGFPPDASVGQTGLERAFEDRVAGRPGGQLIAGNRVIARSAPRPGEAVRSTIDTRLQAAATTALAGRFGGIAVLDARTAEVRGLSGVAFSAPQPPGSTFKIVTTVAALEAGAVRLSEEFPVVDAATIDGVRLENANGEFCGGDFVESFAHSCNSVFAPLGVKVGARRMVEVAERFGWNAPPELEGEAPSTLPPADQIRTPLEVGSTAIGQFKVLATPLRLASVAQTVANGGVRLDPTLVPRRPGTMRRVRVTTAEVARTITGLMKKVVSSGTGTAAAIPGVLVAGKTGTAELEDTRGPEADQTSNPENTDAWFTAFAPADNPRLAVAALFVKAGAGGATAAPAVRAVLATGLGKL